MGRADRAIVLLLLLLFACSRGDMSRRPAAGSSSGAARGAVSSAQPSAVVPQTGAFSLASAAFQNGDTIPVAFTCDGTDRSPALSWTGGTQQTAAYALIVEDPDAPSGTLAHWVVYDVPGSAASLPEGVPPGDTLPALGGAHQGRNGFGTTGYRGPCPPRGPAHHYHFRLAALNARLGLGAGATRDQVVAAMQGHELARAELVGVYARR
jgi:Raf kinase inhibitor-like YbhB/YbcL family protein